MRFLLLLIAPVALSACAVAPPTVASTPDTSVPTATPPATERGVVSAADPRAAEAGAQILREGGNATDAAMAVLLALTVVEPQSSGIGGGGFLVLDPGDGAITTYDGRETAPAAATPDWFLDDSGAPLARRDAIPGGLSTGVPGNVAMMQLAHDAHGRLPWRALFMPAIALARDGFAMTARLHESLASRKATAALTAEARAIYYGENGEPHPVGTVIRNPALAAFLTRLAEEGPDAFYRGENAEAIVAAVRTAPSNPAPMMLHDVTGYRAVERPPVCGFYRAYRVCGMGPPSSGATSVFAILKQLESRDLAALGPQSPTSWHLITESMRLAFADREVWLGDSDLVAVPVAGLMDETYLAARGELIASDMAMGEAPTGTPAGATAAMAPHPGLAEAGTSHFSVADGEGAIASLTSTIEGAFGSGLFVNGYYLNNELTDFSFEPMRDGLPVANRVEAGKRPRSSMSPTILYAPDGRFRMAVGAAGGPTIIAQVAKTIIAVVDWDMRAQEAIAAPVLFAPGFGVFVEKDTAIEPMIADLQALGHKTVRPIPRFFKANAVAREDGVLTGAADPRSEGAVAEE